MKKTLLIICLLFTGILSLQSQSLYGVTYRGGADDGGSINKFIPATGALTLERSFQRTGANPYYTNLVQAADGLLYGMTFNGGGSSGGVIFSYDPTSLTYAKLYDFDIPTGSKPTGSLIQASDGKLYGMTSFGGAQSSGVIFSFTPSTRTYADLYDFEIANGANPSGSLLQAANGKLYGLATQGGANNLGAIFSFDPLSLTYTDLKDFGDSDGLAPVGDLVQAVNGLLYGMTVNGGNNGAGVMFSFNTASDVYRKVKDFDSAGGYYPYGSLVQSSNGKLYGMTYKGGNTNCGVIFSFNTADSVYTKLHDLDSANGGNPFGNLLEAEDGKLYGLTSLGGIYNAGVVFSFDTSSLVYTKLKSFDITNGASPFGSVIQANDGKLYALTFQGGTINSGVLFSYDISATNYTDLKNFGTNINGRNISGSLVRAKDQKLYGMTVFGGTNGKGVIFSFDPYLFTYTKLIDFDSSNGANGYGSLVQAANGKLYGMTLRGGSTNTGVVFSLDPVSLTYTKIKDLDSSDGINPYGSLVQAANGKLYGMTSGGGVNGYGTIFSLDTSTLVYTKHVDLDTISGGNPYGTMLQASDGKLYGMTARGGAGYVDHGQTIGAGVIFSYDPVASLYTKLKDLDYYNTGGFGFGSLLQAKDGNLYGMNSLGGANGTGVIFSYSITGNSFSHLTSFASGSNPYGNLLQATDGKLYGMTYAGGGNNTGVIFSYDTAAALITSLVDFTGDNGSNPYYGAGFIEVPDAGTLPVTLLSFTGKNNNNSNQLSWKVSNENIDHYELQRSGDGQYFTDLSRITSTGNNNYTYTDAINAATSSLFYYRLQIVDIDGKFSYSNIVRLGNSGGDLIAVFPNPFTDNLVVHISTEMREKATLIVSDMSGKQLYKNSLQLQAGVNTVNINGTQKWTKGTYLLTITTLQQTQRIKIVKGL